LSSGRIEGIEPRAAWAHWLASLVDEAELAFELERMDLSDEENGFEDAAGLRPVLLAEVEAAQAEEEGR
jgi:hypothetical protein